MYSSPKFFVPRTTVVPAECAGRANAAANKPIRIATPSEIANAAFAARRVCLRITSTPFELSREVIDETSTPKAPGRYGNLQSEEGEKHGRRQSHDADRGAEHPGKPIARLVDDDVAEAAASRDGGDRRGGDAR